MQLDILRTVDFTDQESKAIDTASTSLGISREEFVRLAVKTAATEILKKNNA